MLPPGTLVAVGLYLIRTSALVLAAPFLGTTTTFGGVKVALIATISFLLFTTAGQPVVGSAGPLAFGAMAVREVLIGLSLAFVLQLALLAVRVAGEMIGTEMAFNMASMVDPATGQNTPIVTQIYEFLFLAGFVAVDGHHFLLRALSDSFERAPVGQVGLGSETIEVLQTLFGEMFAAGLTFAAPVMTLLVLVSVMIGLLSRAVPHVNVLEIGFTLRIGVALVVMFAFAPLLAPAMEHLYGATAVGLESVLEALEY